MSVVIETTLGDITVDLYLKERSRACLNFLKLCKLKYYNFNLFHTIEQGFIAQTGDPTGLGSEGSSVWGVIEGEHKRFFEAEYIPKIRHAEPGLLSMVSTGKNMIGSQFFFTLGSDLTSLDGVHCVIGEISEGHDILRKINEAICDESNRPYQDIRITHTVVLDDPFEDPRGFREPSRSPSPTAERLQNGRIGADEQIDDTEGKTEEEIQEMLAAREAAARATILEIVGDLPDAEIAPPENVLFVCKLNPVTTDDDLEIIFSRFGIVKSCEVIRDKITGDSLQYAFVEFEEKKSCEDAYFKMDNVLIDDRRIHVDFSQSVAKIKWKGKGRIEYADKNDANKSLDFSKKEYQKKNYNSKNIKEYRRRSRSRSPYVRKYDDRYGSEKYSRNRYDDDSRGRQRNYELDRYGNTRKSDTNYNRSQRESQNNRYKDHTRSSNMKNHDSNRYMRKSRSKSRSRSQSKSRSKHTKKSKKSDKSSKHKSKKSHKRKRNSSSSS